MAIGASYEINLAGTLQTMEGMLEKATELQSKITSSLDAILLSGIRMSESFSETLVAIEKAFASTIKFNGIMGLLVKNSIKLVTGPIRLLNFSMRSILKYSKIIFSVFRSLSSLTFNAITSLPGVIGGLFETFSGLSSEGASTSWHAKSIGTNYRNLEALSDVEKVLGSNGTLTTMLENFNDMLTDPQKQHTLLSAGASNRDLDRWRGMDSADAFFEFMRQQQALGKDIGSRDYFEATGMGDLGANNYGEYLNVVNHIGEASGLYGQYKKSIAANEKQMKQLNRTSVELDRTFTNIKQRLLSVFGPAVNEVMKSVSVTLNEISAELVNSGIVKSLTSALTGLAKSLTNFLKDGGIEKLRSWLSSFLEFVEDLFYSIAKILNKLPGIDLDLGIFSGAQEREKQNELLGGLAKTLQKEFDKIVSSSSSGWGLLQSEEERGREAQLINQSKLLAAIPYLEKGSSHNIKNYLEETGKKQKIKLDVEVTKKGKLNINIKDEEGNMLKSFSETLQQNNLMRIQ